MSDPKNPNDHDEAAAAASSIEDKWFSQENQEVTADPAPGAATAVQSSTHSEPAAPRSFGVRPEEGAGGDSWSGESSGSAKIIVDESLMADSDVSSGFSIAPLRSAPATPLAPALPALPDERQPHIADAATQASAQERINVCEREAKAFAADRRAAPLWYEAGGLYEEILRNPRQAATCYQAAFTSDPTYTPVLHAARRLFSEIGNWPMVAHLVTAELRVVTEATAKAPLLVLRGHVLETKLSKDSDAEQSYREALDTLPTCAAAYDALQRRMLQQGRHGEWVELARASMERLPAGPLADRWALDIARVFESPLGDTAAALALYQRVLTGSPGHEEAARARVTALRRLGQDRELTEALVHVAGLSQGAARAVLLVEAARLYRARLEDMGTARNLLERARDASPRNLLVLRELSDLLSATSEHQALADVLLELATTLTDPRERAALYAELGRIFEERLSNEEKAIEQFQRVVELDPHYQPAVVSLGRLYFRHGRYADLVVLYDRELSELQDPLQRVPRLFKVAELLQFQMGDIDGALARYREILEIEPYYIPAQKAVTVLLNAGERWAELVALYENELQHTEDRDQKIFLLDRIGTLHEEKLGDIDKAIDAFERMLVIAPGYLPAIRTLGKLYASAELYADLIRIHDQEAQAIQDPKQVVALLFRTGEIYENHLGDADKAIEVYRKVLGLAPSYLPALKALGRLYHQRGLFRDLIDMNRQEIEVTSDPLQRASLLFKIGEMHEERLDEPDRAVEAYREVLREVPGFYPALRALARIMLSRGDAAGLAEVAKLECEILENPRERAVARCRAALIEEIPLGRDQDAQQTYQAALVDSPLLADAIEALIRIAQRQRDPEAVLEVLRTAADGSEGAQRLALLRRLASVQAHETRRPAEALASFRGILESSPEDVDALQGALHCALELRDYREAISWAERLAGRVPDPASAAALHLQVALWRSSHLDPPEDPTANFLRVLEYEPGNPVALREVETAYTKAGFDEGLYALYLRERELLPDGAQKLHLTLRLADLALGPIHRTEDAVLLLEEAVAADPTSTVALRRLKEAYQTTGRPQDQLRVLALEADASPDPQAAVRSLMEVGHLQESQTGDKNAAADCYLKVLGKDPTNSEAFSRAEHLLGELQRPVELAALYHRRSDVVDGVDSKIGLLLRAAEIEKGTLEKPVTALASFREVLALSPKHVPALVGTADLELALEHHAEAAELYTQVVQTTGDAAITGPIFERLGDLYSGSLADPGRAVQAYVAAMNARPNQPGVLRKLGDLYIAQQAWPQASDVLAKRLTFAPGTEDKLDTLFKLAQVCETGLNNPAQAAQFLEQAITLSPSSPQTVERLAGLYRRSGDFASLASALTRMLNSTPAEQRQTLLPLYRELAAVYEQNLGQIDKAIDVYRALLGVDPSDSVARTKLATLFESQPASRDRAIEEYRKLAEASPVQVTAYRGLRKLFDAEGVHDKKYCACEILAVLRSTDEDESFFFEDNRNRAPQQLDYGLSEEQHEQWLVHPDERTIVRRIVRACSTELSKVFPADLTAYQVTRNDRITPKTNDPLRGLCDSLAHALTDNRLSFDLYRCRAKALALAVQNTDPPSLIVGSEIIRRHPTREQRFLVGSQLEGLISGHHLLEGMDAVGLATFISALGLAIQSGFPPLPGAGDVEELSKRVAKALSRGARKTLAPLIAELDQGRAQINLQRYLQATDLTRVRAGMLLANDIESALRLVARDLGVNYSLNDIDALNLVLLRQPRMREIFAFSISEDYFSARRALHVAIDL
ncbi:MAG: tetratricopeptide repeat protein [Pseudomonadota bacterium]